LINNWLADHLRKRSLIETELQFHLYARVAPYISTWDSMFKVCALFGAELILSPRMDVPCSDHEFRLLADDQKVEAITQALIASVVRYFDFSADYRTLAECRRAVADVSASASELVAFRATHPVVEALTWLPHISPDNLIAYVKQYCHVFYIEPEITSQL
jgi:hypothetical protein